jgi:hypothetical protein
MSVAIRKKVWREKNTFKDKHKKTRNKKIKIKMLELLPLALVRAATRSGEREQQIFRSSLTTPTLSFFCLFVCSLSLSFSISLSLSLFLFLSIALSLSLYLPLSLILSFCFFLLSSWDICFGSVLRQGYVEICFVLFQSKETKNKKNSKSQISVINCFPLTAEQDWVSSE